MGRKSDNSDPAAKLDLRRHFLRRYHLDHPPDVLDCCQGGGLLWAQLRREFELHSYWGVDVKPKKGRLKLDSVRILSQPGWPQDVIDVDTYGSPWKHYAALTAQISHPTTVFLTIGQVLMATDRKSLDALGLGGIKVPPAIGLQLQDLALAYLLTDSPATIIYALEAISAGSARYIGLRLQP